MNVAIVGGTGTVGAEAARTLSSRGHHVRVLSRGAPEYPVDLTDGTGLMRALEGVDVVVDASQGGRDVLVEGTRRLLAAELAAGVRHHVGVSIVGIDRVRGRYYRTKLEQEAEIVRSGVPWTIVRATQFHQLLDRVFTASARFGLLPAVPMPVQPVDPSEVGRLLADMAETEPSLAILQFAGPEVVGVDQLARCWRESTGSRALPIRVPVPRSLRQGALTNPVAWRGKVTFDRWLASS
jgi:uncharacterized protein YbjT (DUF2867 family)